MKKTLYILIICLMVGFVLPSCNKSDTGDDYPIMEDYYVESLALPTVSLDSVNSFSCKVNGYVAQFPAAKQHRRYVQILENIKSASLRIIITVDTTWAGTDSISF